MRHKFGENPVKVDVNVDFNSDDVFDVIDAVKDAAVKIIFAWTIGKVVQAVFAKAP